ncbi:trypsin domain-containing protein [Phthorimaea operculella]|nr:trypsin domain-containing protein [Phthorimaea operculella]
MKHFTIFFAAITFLNVKAEERIAGGSPVPLEAYPFAAALLTNRGEGLQYTQACGGSILTSNAILSAASCFYTNGTADEVSWWRARVGSVYSTRGGIIHLIRQISAHPQFSPDTRSTDLAVLRTTVDINMPLNNLQPATIAGAAMPISAFQPIWAIGWGLTAAGSEPSEELRAVEFFVVEQQVCANRYAALNFTVNDDAFCTGWLDVGVTGQCEGDGGSPVILDGTVVGVHSWVEGCADGLYPGVNTRVGPYTQWITRTALA